MTTYDAVIVGGGPAGLAAALTLGRASRPVLVLDSGAPRNAPAAAMHNVLGRDGTPPARLRADGRRELAAYPTVTIRDEAAVRVEPGFSVALAGGDVVAARRIVLATGVVDELPDLPGFAELWGRSVLHCPYCHGYEVRGQRLAVLGGTPHHAFLASLLRARYSDDVVLLTGGADVVAPDGVDVAAEPVASLAVRDGRLAAVVFADGTALERDALFGGGRPRQHSPFAADLGCAMLDDGSVEVDDFGHTSVPGVLAVGDMARRASLPGPMAAVAAASASGLLAGVAVDQGLHAEDTGLPSPFAQHAHA